MIIEKMVVNREAFLKLAALYPGLRTKKGIVQAIDKDGKVAASYVADTFWDGFKTTLLLAWRQGKKHGRVQKRKKESTSEH